MTEKPQSSAQLSVGLSGKLLQFNITLGLLGSLSLGLFVTAVRSNTPIITYLGTVGALLGFVGLFFLAFNFYFKQKSRPLDGQNVAISIKDETGRELSIQNPPDSVFEKEQLTEVTRLMLVGFDESLCPDGEVIGKASERKFRLYSDEEKEQFRIRHREEIKGKKLRAAKILEQGHAQLDLPSPPDKPT
jgi:hypothetical protein